MDKIELLEKVKKQEYTHEKLVGWITCLPTGGISAPSKSLAGDVYMHPIFKHPYVLLKKVEDSWICTLLTSKSTCPEVLEECKSRFFNKSYITKVLFTASTLDGIFMGVYENKTHLNKIYKELKEIFK